MNITRRQARSLVSTTLGCFAAVVLLIGSFDGTPFAYLLAAAELCRRCFRENAKP